MEPSIRWIANNTEATYRWFKYSSSYPDLNNSKHESDLALLVAEDALGSGDTDAKHPPSMALKTLRSCQMNGPAFL